MAPSFFKPSTIDALLDFLEPVVSAADGLPFYYYDIPTLTGVRLPMVEFWQKGKSRISDLAGIKYTNSDLVQLQLCIQASNGECEILFGCDEAVLAGLALGAHGAVGSSYNFAMPIYRGVLDAYRSGNDEVARGMQKKSAEMINIISHYDYVPAAKSVMAMIGVDCGPVRPPLAELTPSEKMDLRNALGHLNDLLPINGID